MHTTEERHVCSSYVTTQCKYDCSHHTEND